MLTFYQLLEAIKHNEFDDNSDKTLTSVLYGLKDKNDLLKIGLYCAKDCYELNSEETKPLAKKCINVIEKYLNSKEIDYALTNNARRAYRNALDIITYRETDSVRCSLLSAASAATVISFDDFVDINDHIGSSMFNAANAFASKVNYGNYINVYNKKISEYIGIANSMKSTSTNKVDKGFTITKDTLLQLHDMLEEMQEDLVIRDKNDKYRLNTPKNFPVIVGDSIDDLWKKIQQHDFIIDWLKRVYENN